jgi:hypothetical protein
VLGDLFLLILLCELTAAGMARGLPPRVAFAPGGADKDVADALGFRSAGPPPEYAAAGRRYMEWAPPVALNPKIPGTSP